MTVHLTFLYSIGYTSSSLECNLVRSMIKGQGLALRVGTCGEVARRGAARFMAVFPACFRCSDGAVVSAALFGVPVKRLPVGLDEGLRAAHLLQELPLHVLGLDPGLLLLPTGTKHTQSAHHENHVWRTKELHVPSKRPLVHLKAHYQNHVWRTKELYVPSKGT